MTHKHKATSLWALKKQEMSKLWKEAYVDRERSEHIATRTYPLLEINRADVLRQSMKYLHPRLNQHKP